MSDQPGLFGEPEPAAIPLPRAAKPAKQKVTYASYTARADCADCVQLAYETAMDGDFRAVPIRQARVKRTTGQERLLLCHEHAQHRKVLDATERRG